MAEGSASHSGAWGFAVWIQQMCTVADKVSVAQRKERRVEVRW